ncbi:hypothetical protein [Amycolatopsis pigmentata]|uniref:DUF4177 domain-containing protein n=1 Tax=Amycolatopsis pigmentata TaxID=450801 RepID=A0ABW5G4X3_9PSEU
MSEWQYRQTSLAAAGEMAAAGKIKGFDDTVNAHLAKMADAGWELVAATSTIAGSFSKISLGASYGSAPYGETKFHHYIWKRLR